MGPVLSHYICRKCGKGIHSVVQLRGACGQGVVYQWGTTYTRKNAQLVTSSQTNLHKSVYKLSTRRTACSQLLEQIVNSILDNLQQA